MLRLMLPSPARRRRARRTGAPVGLVAAAALLVPVTAQPAPAAQAGAPVPVPAVVETAPVPHRGDAADDPAVWVHPTDPARSLVIGNDKLGGLETYDLQGRRQQTITTGTRFWGNVDVRGNLVATWNGGGVRVYRVDPASRRLQPATEGGVVRTGSGEGLCLWRGPDGLHVYAISRAGVLRQYRLGDADGDGLLAGALVRTVDVGSEAEGCVADDASGAVYVSEEDVALWRYAAAAGAGASRTAVDRTVARGGRIAADIEGVTLAGNLLVVSAQAGNVSGASSFLAYDRNTLRYVRSFRVVAGAAADDCDGTDGITAHAGPLGPTFPRGVFVCQDGANGAPGATGRQSFKLARWDAVTGG